MPKSPIKYTSAKKVSIHHLRDLIAPMIEEGDLSSWDRNALELPGHFAGVVKHVKAVTFTACPSCLEDGGYGSKHKVEPSATHPHSQAYTPMPWISSQYEILGRIIYAHTNSRALGDDSSTAQAYPFSPRGLAPIAEKLERCPIGIALGAACMWPQGMIEHKGAGEVSDPNINFAVICPKHGSVWATISTEMVNVLLLTAGTKGGGKLHSPPGPKPEIDLMNERPEIWSYDPDDDMGFFSESMTIKDLRSKEEKKHTYGLVSAGSTSSSPEDPARLSFFPFFDEVDQIAAEEHIKTNYPNLSKLATYTAAPWENGNISIGRVLRLCFEMAALDSGDSATFLNGERRPITK